VPNSEYCSDWPEVATGVKDVAGWKCIRCGHRHEPEAGYVLTVHHMDMDPSNNKWWNLLALCQRCHLTIQAKVDVHRMWMFDHSEWIKPYLAGMYAAWNHKPDDREYVSRNIEMLLNYGRPAYDYDARHTA
jgi:hypothetical protein